jgi:hypothetical protein
LEIVVSAAEFAIRPSTPACIALLRLMGVLPLGI